MASNEENSQAALMEFAKNMIADHQLRTTQQIRKMFAFVETFKKVYGVDPIQRKIEAGKGETAASSNPTSKYMPKIGSDFKEMSRMERDLLVMLNQDGALESSIHTDSFVDLMRTTHADHWDFRSVLLEVLRRSNQQVKQTLMFTDFVSRDILTQWLFELKDNVITYESIIHKILSIIMLLPFDKVSVEGIKATGRCVRKHFSKNRKDKLSRVSNRIEILSVEVLAYLMKQMKENIRRDEKEAAEAASRKKSKLSKAKRAKPVEPKAGPPRKRPRARDLSAKVPISLLSDSTSSELVEEEDLHDSIRVEAPIALPKIIIGGTMSKDTPRKKKKSKKTVRFNLERNTEHYVPFKEKSTRAKNREAKDEKFKLSKAEKMLLNRSTGAKAIEIHGLESEMKWQSPRLVAGIEEVELASESSELIRLKKKRKNGAITFSLGSNASPPDNPSAQNMNDRVKKMKFSTREIPSVVQNATASAASTAPVMGIPPNVPAPVMGLPPNGGYAAPTGYVNAPPTGYVNAAPQYPYSVMPGTALPPAPMVMHTNIMGMIPPVAASGSQSMEICKFHRLPGGCMRGAACKYRHI